jgi:hypothetical protein
MARLLATAAALVMLATAASAQNTQGRPSAEKPDPKKEARLQFRAAHAALYSALAHAEALKALAQESGDIETDLALPLVKTVSRDANSCNTSSVKLGQALGSAEKDKHMKTLRSELDEAMKCANKAHEAVDGHGKLGPPAEEAAEHLRKANDAMLKLADAVGTKPLPSPNADSDKGGQGR